MGVRRRELLSIAPLAGLAGALPALAKEAPREGPTSDLYRVDEPALIMAAARAIIDEDYVGVLVTIDEDGMPRARPIGVADPKDDWSLWMATRRGSRKTLQIAANPKAALHFGFDDTANNHAGSFYASFTGLASVHTDPEAISEYGPSEKYRTNWPNYPNDLALIRLLPQRLEVMGKGIWPNESMWQPQGILLAR